MVETNEPTNHFNTHQTQWCQSHYEVALNMHHQSLKKFEKVEKTVFLGLILRFSNLNVLHKGQTFSSAFLLCDTLSLMSFKLSKK